MLTARQLLAPPTHTASITKKNDDNDRNLYEFANSRRRRRGLVGYLIYRPKSILPRRQAATTPVAAKAVPDLRESSDCSGGDLPLLRL